MISRKTQAELAKVFVELSKSGKVRDIVKQAKRRHKYGAEPIAIDGIRFASTKEGKRYAELKLLAKAGEIRNLQLQVKIPFQVGGNKTYSFIYIADFTYNNRTGQLVVEDVKGARTPVYRLKKKLIEAYYGIEITEI